MNGSKPPDGASPKDFESKFGEALKAAGVSDDDVSKIQDEIKSTSLPPRSIRMAAPTSGAPESAVDSVLQKHGLDPEKIQEEQFRSHSGPPPGGPPPGAGQSGGNGSSSSATTTQDAKTTEDILQQLLSSGNLDNSTSQLLQSLLPSLNVTA